MKPRGCVLTAGKPHDAEETQALCTIVLLLHACSIRSTSQPIYAPSLAKAAAPTKCWASTGLPATSDEILHGRGCQICRIEASHLQRHATQDLEPRTEPYPAATRSKKTTNKHAYTEGNVTINNATAEMPPKLKASRRDLCAQVPQSLRRAASTCTDDFKRRSFHDKQIVVAALVLASSRRFKPSACTHFTNLRTQDAWLLR